MIWWLKPPESTRVNWWSFVRRVTRAGRHSEITPMQNPTLWTACCPACSQKIYILPTVRFWKRSMFTDRLPRAKCIIGMCAATIATMSTASNGLKKATAFVYSATGPMSTTPGNIIFTRKREKREILSNL